MMNSKISVISKLFFTWLIVFVLWLAFTTSIEIYEVLTGLFISFIISLFTFKSFTSRGLKGLSPIKLIYVIKYIFVFLIALVKANFHVAKIVLSPSLPINPGIVEFESKLDSDFAKMILANSITLTPGTLSVDVIGNRFYIHWLEVKDSDSEVAFNEIAKQFEDVLLKIYS
ncbi:MAG: Na+/H+ antiporter subunit E [Bacteroidales bacterium]|nr:Na+/H+ antiporter subunit E [Bacteroidales bacterium]MBN2757232.1 Na+/H+ antiporter subunit E [Bacteroidales bacterium]